MTLPESVLNPAQSITVAGLQKIVDDWCTSIGVRYFNELTNLAQLMEEVGELSRIISRTYGEQIGKADEQSSNLADEIADVLFVLVCLANQTGVDLTKAIEMNLAKKNTRDINRHRENPKLRS